MRRLLFLATLILLLSNGKTNAQLRSINNNAFQRGEFLKFRTYYDAVLTGEVNAGFATFEISNENKSIAGRNTLHVIGEGKTLGAFNLFFKVVDRYESYIDEQTMAPLLFIRRVNEGGHIIKQDLTFDQKNSVVYFEDIKKKRKSTVQTPQYIQDIISAFYYTRTFDFSKAQVGQKYDISFILDDSIYVTNIYYQGKDTITTSLGTFRCLKFKPKVLTGNVFKEAYPMTMWVTDDENKIPIFAKSGVLVGTVKLELINFKNLKNNIEAKL